MPLSPHLHLAHANTCRPTVARPTKALVVGVPDADGETACVETRQIEDLEHLHAVLRYSEFLRYNGNMPEVERLSMGVSTT